MSTETELLTGALKIALQMENEGYAFYGRAVERTESERGKKVFAHIMQQEQDHIRRITREYQAMTNTGQWQAPLEPVGEAPPLNPPALFPKSEAEIEARVSTHADDMEALKIAVDIESKGLKFYHETAAKTGDKLGKAFFEWLAGQEKEHRKIFQDYYDYLENPAFWFQMQEHQLLEG